MKVTVLTGSPHEGGNTDMLLEPIVKVLENKGCSVQTIRINNTEMIPCQGCEKCQDSFYKIGCVLRDGGTEIMEEIAESDGIIIATPIFNWYCTTQTKALLDRMYCLVKCNNEPKSSFVKGVKCGLVSTHGDPSEDAMPMFETTVKNFCDFALMEYAGSCEVATPDGAENVTCQEVQDMAKAYGERYFELVAKDCR